MTATPDVRDSWRRFPAAQQPTWPDAEALAPVLEELATQPPLVFAGECDNLRARLAEVAAGRAVLLQGGDCAETFAGATADAIRGRIKTVLQMAVVLTYGASLPVVKVGRMAGQFAKPRSSDLETRDGVSLPAYRGDAVNGIDFTLEARTPDPRRLLRTYNTSAATLNLIRAFTQGGFADLRQVHAWNQGFVRDTAAGERYERMASDIENALAFMEAVGVDAEEFRSVDFYASHEALLLDYERALTRIDSRTGLPYDVSAHLVWMGERTRSLDGAHVEFLSTIHNPVGIKLGPTADPDEVLELLRRVDPDEQPGRITLIVRMGAGKVRDVLPALVAKVEAERHGVVWVCDPMHGNTITSPGGVKTRRFDDVVEEVRGFFEVHREIGSYPGGLHVELTGDDVTECVGGSGQLVDIDDLDDLALANRYETACDPRLNHQQSLELAFVVAEMLRDGRRVR